MVVPAKAKLRNSDQERRFGFMKMEMQFEAEVFFCRLAGSGWEFVIILRALRTVCGNTAFRSTLAKMLKDVLDLYQLCEEGIVKYDHCK